MTQRKTFSLHDGLDMFLLDCEARRLTPLTIRFYKQNVSLFLEWCEGQGLHQLEELSAPDIRKFLVSIQRRDLSSQYQNNLARSIRAFLNYCVRDELIQRSPFDRIQMPKVTRRYCMPSPLNRFNRFCAIARRTGTEPSVCFCWTPA